MFLCLLKNAAFSNKPRVFAALGCRPWGGRCFPGVWTWVISALGEERGEASVQLLSWLSSHQLFAQMASFFLSLPSLSHPPPQLESVNTRGLKQVGEINF